MDAGGQRELARLLSEDGLSPREAAARLGTDEAEARAQIARWYAAGERRSPGATRRRLTGIALVLAFVPVGWVASAAVFNGDGNGASRDRVSGAPPVRAADAFAARAARARRSRNAVSVARVPARRVQVYASASPRAKRTLLRGRSLEGKPMPLVLLVERRRRGWLKVQLPTRPNLATGWIRRRAVRLTQNEWRLRVDLSAFTVTTWRGKRRVSVHKIGVGRSVSPTPRGRYYLTDLVKPPNPNGLYGTYAFGLSAHSKVFTSFGTGNGQIGIHGTNDPKTLGTNVSHGCIRVANSVIESFARHLPLGTPVTIRS